MVHSLTKSQSQTYTETRANYVTGKIYQELLGIHYRGLITKKIAEDLRAILLELQKLEELSFLEVQFTKPNGTKCALKYEIDSTGLISIDDRSGGIDYYDLPGNSVVSFLVSLNLGKKKEEALEYLKNLGWGENGRALEGDTNYVKSFSKEGYGFKQNKINW
jgi:hypothetical protein